MRTHLHMAGCNILIVVFHHVGKEGHVVGHPQAPMHFDWLTGKQAVSTAASHPYQRQAQPQWSWHQHCSGWLEVSVCFFVWTRTGFFLAQYEAILAQMLNSSGSHCHPHFTPPGDISVEQVGVAAGKTFPSAPCWLRMCLWVTDEYPWNERNYTHRLRGLF